MPNKKGKYARIKTLPSMSTLKNGIKKISIILKIQISDLISSQRYWITLTREKVKWIAIIIQATISLVFIAKKEKNVKTDPIWIIFGL